MSMTNFVVCIINFIVSGFLLSLFPSAYFPFPIGPDSPTFKSGSVGNWLTLRYGSIPMSLSGVTKIVWPSKNERQTRSTHAP